MFTDGTVTFGNVVEGYIMIWQSPEVLYFLFLIPVIIFGLWVCSKSKYKQQINFASNEAFDRMFKQDKWLRKAFVLSLIYGFLIIALAKPQWGYRWESIHRKGIDIVVVLDTSKSMLATDVLPNRLARAKREIIDLLKLLKGDRISLIPFAGSAHVLFPLTFDYSAARLFIDDINQKMIPDGGTNVAAAINMAIDSFKSVVGKHRAIVVITDGESHDGDIQGVIDRAKQAGVHIFTVGIGTKEGSRIEILKDGHKTFLKDANGNIAFSKLDETTLQLIATQTGGAYLQASAGALGLEELYRRYIEPMQPKDMQQQRVKRHFQRFQYPLAIAIVLLFVYIIIGLKYNLLFLLLFILSANSVKADAFDDIERGQKLLKSNPKEAVNAFINAQVQLPENIKLQYNLGVAQYKAGDFKNAAKSFSAVLKDKELGLRSRYNLGNAVLKQKKYKDAIANYEAVLKVNPKDKNAKFNLEYAKKELEKQKKQQKQKDDKKQQDKKDKKNQKDKKNKDGKNNKKDKDNTGNKKSNKKNKQNKKDKKDGDSKKNKSDKNQQNNKKQKKSSEAKSNDKQTDANKLSKKDLKKLMQEAQQREKDTRRTLYMQFPSTNQNKVIEKDW